MNIASLKLNNNLLLAPMAGISDLPYRLIMKRHGAALVFTEMVSANGMIRDGRRTLELLRSVPEERPLAVQLFGDDAEVLARSAEMVTGAGELLDINIGCPVPKVVRSGAGSALLRDPKKVGAIVSAVRRAWSGPLTIKIRSGWDQHSLNYLEVARIAVAEGIDAITLHPRTRAQGFSGHSDWGHIAALKKTVSVPVIGSGDIFQSADALRMLAETGCDGVMIGRGGYGNPWIFRDILAMQCNLVPHPPTAYERLQLAREHLLLFSATYDERLAVIEMRKHLCWYARGLAGAANFRSQVNTCHAMPDLLQLLDDFFLSAEAA
jgi:hypothetical protein